MFENKNLFSTFNWITIVSSVFLTFFTFNLFCQPPNTDSNFTLFIGDQIAESIFGYDTTTAILDTISNEEAGIRRIRTDRVNQKVYWTVGTGHIRRSNLDGSNIKTINDSVSTNINLIEISPTHNLLYFTETGTGSIKSSNLDGTNVKTIITDLGNTIQGLDTDPINHHIYWTESNSGRIKRANLDGSEIQVIYDSNFALFDLQIDPFCEVIYFSERSGNSIYTIDFLGNDLNEIITNSQTVGAISLDLNNQKIYWVESEAAKISKANFDGTNREVVIDKPAARFSGADILHQASPQNLFLASQQEQSLITYPPSLDNPTIISSNEAGIRRIRADKVGQKLYWTASTGHIRRADFDGSNLEDINANVSNGINVIAISNYNNSIYFTETGLNSIKQSNLDGSNVQTILSEIGEVQGLDIDSVNQHIYWTEFDSGTIKRANLDGSNIELVYSANEELFDLQLDMLNETIYFSERTNNKIYRIGFDGQDLVEIASNEGIVGAISLDLINSEIFWVESSTDKVFKANLNGHAKKELFHILNADFSGLEILPNQSCISDFVSSTNTPTYTEPINILIYPNPTSNQLTIDLKDTKNLLYNIELYGISGKKYISQTTNQTKNSLSLNALPKGMYFLRINAVFVKKIVVQ